MEAVVAVLRQDAAIRAADPFQDMRGGALRIGFKGFVKSLLHGWSHASPRRCRSLEDG
jgi:hypothetical protein